MDKTTIISPLIKLTRSKAKWAILAIVPLSVVFSILFLNVVYRNSTKNTQAHYSKLDAYAVQCSGAGSGMAFNKPIEVKAISSDQCQVVLGDFVTSSDQATISYKGYIAGYVDNTNSKVISDNDLAQISDAILHGNNIYHNQTVTPIQQFVGQRLPVGWSVQLGEAQKYTSSHIKNDAWKFDLKATSNIKVTPVSTVGNAPIPNTKNTPPNTIKNALISGPMEGRVIYAISGQKYYYFLALAESKNWSSNQPIWQKVFDSLKLDN